MKRLGFWTGLVVLAAVVGGALSYKPWSAYLEQRRMANESQAVLEAAEKAKARNERERATLDSRAGKEATAREQGFTKPGEKPLEPPSR